jgi:hypothetical protein
MPTLLGDALKKAAMMNIFIPSNIPMSPSFTASPRLFLLSAFLWIIIFQRLFNAGFQW